MLETQQALCTGIIDIVHPNRSLSPVLIRFLQKKNIQ